MARKKKSAAVPLAIIGAVIAALLIAVFMAGGAPDVDQTASVTVGGTALAQYPESGGDPTVGSQAPTIRGTSFDGSDVQISNDGKPKILLFLAHW